MAYNPARQQRLTLALGFLAFTVGIVSAYRNPARAYELNIYAATPITFWAGVGLAALTGLLVAYHPRVTSTIRVWALVLASLSILAIIALPILRNYYFFGPGDSLSHLGYTRLLAEDRLSPYGLLYPGIHTTTLFISQLLNIPLTRAMQYMVLVFSVAYLVFVPLCVREVASSQWALVTGTIVGLLLLPINNVSVFMLPYPTTQAIFLLPLILFLAIRYVTLPDDGFPRSLTPFGLLLLLSSIAIVLVHPQQAGSVLLVFGGIIAVQFVFRWRRSDHAISEQRPFYFQFVFLAFVFLLWAPRFRRVTDTGQGLVVGLVGPERVGNEVTRRAGSLATLGGSVPELFGKLFGVSVLLSIPAGFVILLGLLGRLEDPRGTVIRYLSVGHILLSLSFLVFFLGSVSVLPFRYLGAVMALVSIIAAVGLADGIPIEVSWPSWRVMRAVAVLVFSVLLAVQMAHVHDSPHVFQPSDQVTKATMVGYENSFEYRDQAVWFTGVRGGPRRYIDATYGTTYTDRTPGGKLFEGKESQIPFRVFGNNLTQHYGRDRYISITDKDVQQEVRLYEGFRYSLSGFRSLETTPRIHRIRSNGDFRLYYADQQE